MCRRDADFALWRLDSLYTKDSDGNGWYVPYVPATDDVLDKAGRVLNLLSLAVNDRATVAGKIESAMDRASRAIDMPYLQAIDLLNGRLGAWQQFGMYREIGNPVDGGLAQPMWYSYAYTQFIDCGMWQAAAVTSLALSAYRTEHGAYPARLADLVPEYLQAVPIGPLHAEPLRYRLDERDGYSLYSPRGDTGIDRGGRLRDASGELLTDRNKTKDQLYAGLDRPEPRVEWYLVDDKEQQGAASPSR